MEYQKYEIPRECVEMMLIVSSFPMISCTKLSFRIVSIFTLCWNPADSMPFAVVNLRQAADAGVDYQHFLFAKLCHL
jgi:hypothetical protein